MLVVGRNGEMLAASIEARESLISTDVPQELLMQVRDNRPYVSLEPLDDGRLSHHHGRTHSRRRARWRRRFLLARYDLPRQLAISPMPCSTPIRNMASWRRCVSRSNTAFA